ncbi:DUF5719 family protein [Nocardioides sp. WS12]|uniref:DUF5719 family protein n=1 Tax=Nocardioides sp. WS12 TaxID=2486272 RepID=UPI0015F97A24|nr:DUF5719 family protein [Nocardioides sp. WS12]
MTESSTSSTPGAGRRSSVTPERRIDIIVALAIVLPTVVALCVTLIGREGDPVAGLRPPTTSTLTAATLACPAGLDGTSGPVRAVRAPGVPGGKVAVRTSATPVDQGSGTSQGTTKEGAEVTVTVGGGVVVPASGGATVLDGRGDAAPGLVAGRGDRLAVPECRAPSYDEWLVGISGSARYATTLELVNPDDGDAVVDLELLGPAGPIDEPGLRGIQVPGHSVKRLELAKVAPMADVAAAHLTVTRGRVTATARNTRDPLGRGRVTTDFLPAHAEPATTNLILGIPERRAGPTLFLANPGADEIRVTTRLVTADASFTPAGAEEIKVAPHSIRTVSLTSVLSGDAAKGVVGVELRSTGPVTSSVRLLTKTDLVLLAPVPLLRDPAAAVLPLGAKTLLLGGADRTGVVHVKSYDAAGTVLADKPVEVGPDRAVSLALPPKAVTITVEARNTTVGAVVSIPATGRGPGLATIRVRAAELRSRIPVVVPQ